MASVVTSVRHRIDPAPVTALVALGDLGCLAAFVVAGSVGGHGMDPVAQAPRIAATYATFLVGWLVAAVLAGLYTADARRSAKRAVTWTVPAWVVAALVAQGLRATPAVPGDAALTFFLVSVGVGLALLVPYRVAVTRLVPRG